jgi:MFS family permease
LGVSTTHGESLTARRRPLGEFADLYGRKTSLLLIMALYSVGGAALWFGNAVLDSLALVVTARFACGVAAGATTVVLPVYLGEVAAMMWRIGVCALTH